MPVELLQPLLENWVAVLGIFLTGMLAYWIYDEAEEAADAEDTIRRVTDRAERATGRTVRGSRALTVGIFGVFMTAAVELLGFAAELNGLLGGIPFVVGSVVVTALGFLGIAGAFSTTTYGYAVLLVLLGAAFVRYGNEANS